MVNIEKYYFVMNRISEQFPYFIFNFCHSGNVVITKLRLHIWRNKNNKRGFHYLVLVSNLDI